MISTEKVFLLVVPGGRDCGPARKVEKKRGESGGENVKVEKERRRKPRPPGGGVFRGKAEEQKCERANLLPQTG